MPGTHALLSASGAARWIRCPPSARLEENFADSTSAYAQEGTWAHALGEAKLMRENGELSAELYDKEYKMLSEGPLFCPAMDEYTDAYADYVMERFNALAAAGKHPTLYIEQRLDFSRWVPEGFGTGDAVIVADGEITVIDLKYGKGVPVDAKENPQLRLYALGAIESLGCLYGDFTKATAVVYQPRLEHVTEETLAVKELRAWAKDVVAPAAALAYEGAGELCAGEHCRFCRARAVCRKRAEANLSLAQREFAPPELLTSEEIAEVLGKAAELKAWAGDVEEYALEQASRHGARFPGWKLVEGRSNRAYIDAGAVAEKLKEAGYAWNTIYKPSEVYGITEMERKLGKKDFSALLGGLVHKPAGKPVLVPQTDKRAEINSLETARQEFAAPMNEKE